MPACVPPSVVQLALSRKQSLSRVADRDCCACAGFGLDFVWPYLADYPENKIAVIDDTCIMRPTHILGPSPLFEVFKNSKSTKFLQQK